MTTALQSPVSGGKERRQHKRHKVHPDALVFLGKEPGTIIDLSEGGVAIHFVSMKHGTPLPKHLDLFFAQNRMYLTDLPVMVVNELSTPPYSIFSSLSTKRFCLQFGPLSNDQQARLRQFLQTCSVSEN
ncbi:MAG: PilZ domain-containing protein [Desulfobulbus sp.]|nr:PilZ domain-containing protein [Desulfobulbus sp.]